MPESNAILLQQLELTTNTWHPQPEKAYKKLLQLPLIVIHLCLIKRLHKLHKQTAGQKLDHKKKKQTYFRDKHTSLI